MDTDLAPFTLDDLLADTDLAAPPPAPVSTVVSWSAVSGPDLDEIRRTELRRLDYAPLAYVGGPE